MNPVCSSILPSQNTSARQAPKGQAELVQFKVTQFQATAKKLCEKIPTCFQFDGQLLTELLKDQLSKHPEARDPFNIHVRLNTATGELHARHFNLLYSQKTIMNGFQAETHSKWKPNRGNSLALKSVKYGSGACETGIWGKNKNLIFGKRTAPNGSTEIGRFRYIKETGQSQLCEHDAVPTYALGIILNSEFKSSQDAINFLNACNTVLQDKSALAKLSFAIEKNQADALPAPDELRLSLNTSGGKTPDVKIHTCQSMISAMIVNMIEPVIGQIEKNQAVPWNTINKLTQTVTVLLNAVDPLGTSDEIAYKADLYPKKSAILYLLFKHWVDTAIDQQPTQLNEQIQQFKGKLELALVNAVSHNPWVFQFMPTKIQSECSIATAAVKTRFTS